MLPFVSSFLIFHFFLYSFIGFVIVYAFFLRSFHTRLQNVLFYISTNSLFVFTEFLFVDSCSIVFVLFSPPLHHNSCQLTICLVSILQRCHSNLMSAYIYIWRSFASLYMENWSRKKQIVFFRCGCKKMKKGQINDF